jgi:rare lipoprotein A
LPTGPLKNPRPDAQYGEAHISAIAKSHLLVVVLLLVALLRPANAADRKPDECGLASAYSTVSEATASGEDTLAEDFTAAHRSLPFGTLVHVDSQKNGRSAVVRITDRGPFISGRIIDVSQAAARALGISGLTPVCLNVTWVPVSRPAARK